jgi:hypothetical protein
MATPAAELTQLARELRSVADALDRIALLYGAADQQVHRVKPTKGEP